MVRDEITFRGRVQGVGFRFTTAGVAARYAVTGWVRNEPDGTVRLVVEGEATEVDRFLEELRTVRHAFIEGEDAVRVPATGSFDRFEIRR